MPFVERGADGRIAALHRDAPAGVPSPEQLSADHPEVQAFLGSPELEGFGRLDADFVRVIEDVIDVLLSRHLIQLTDLPPEAQAKLLRRKGARDGSGRTRLDLFGGERAPPRGGDII